MHVPDVIIKYVSYWLQNMMSYIMPLVVMIMISGYFFKHRNLNRSNHGKTKDLL